MRGIKVADIIVAMIKSAPSDIRVLLFDVGGVLVQLSGVEVMLEWLDHRISVDELWRRWLQSVPVRKFETGPSLVWRLSHDNFWKHLSIGLPGFIQAHWRCWHAYRARINELCSPIAMRCTGRAYRMR